MKETALKATETDPNVINPRRVRFQLCSEGWILRRLLLLADVLVVLARLLEGGGVTGYPRASATAKAVRAINANIGILRQKGEGCQ